MKCPLHSGELIRIDWQTFVCIPNSFYTKNIHEIQITQLENTKEAKS